MNTLRWLLALTALTTSAACGPRTAEQCVSDVEGMREVLEGAVEEAAYCEVDADCAMMDPSNLCEDRCPVAVNVAEVEAVSQKLWDGELSFCVAYGEDCGFTSVTCEARFPVCNLGRCEMVAE